MDLTPEGSVTYYRYLPELSGSCQGLERLLHLTQTGKGWPRRFFIMCITSLYEVLACLQIRLFPKIIYLTFFKVQRAEPGLNPEPNRTGWFSSGSAFSENSEPVQVRFGEISAEPAANRTSAALVSCVHIEGTCKFTDKYAVHFPLRWCYFLFQDRKSTRLNSSHSGESRMPSSA